MSAGRRRRPLVSVDGDLNGSHPSKKSRKSNVNESLGQKRIDSFFPNSEDQFEESHKMDILQSRRSSSEESLKSNSRPNALEETTNDEKLVSSCSSMSKPIGPREINHSSRMVHHRHAAIYGSDVSLWGSYFSKSDSVGHSEPLHPWFENAFNAYIHSDSGDEEHHTNEVNRLREEESWLKILDLLNNSLSSRQHLSYVSVHKLLVHGVAHKHSSRVRARAANLFRKMIHYLAVPDSKRMRSYYLRALAREEKGVDEFDDMEPWELLEFLLESVLAGSSQYALLFTVIVELLEIDFDFWCKSSCSDPWVQPPMLYKVLRFSGESPRLNYYSQKIVQTYVSALLDKNSQIHLKSLRILVAILAQILGCQNNENKLDFVHFVAQVLRDQDSLLNSMKRLLLTELYLLKPSWLSFCLSNALIAHLTNLRPIRGQSVSLRSALESYIQSITNEQDPKGCETRTPRKITLKKIHIAVDKRNVYGETPLHIACKKGNLERVHLILASPKVDVNAKDNNGWTPLHEACAHGMVGCVKALMDYKPTDIKNFLIKGSSQNQATCSKRVDLLAIAGENGINPFHDCIIADNLELVNIIMEKVKSDSEFPSIQSLLKSFTQSGLSCLDLVKSKEMQLLLQGFNDKTSIPRRVVVKEASFEMIKFLLVNFMSKYISYFSLHVQKDFISFISKKNEKKGYIRTSSWKVPTRAASGHAFCTYQRTRETAVRDIRSYCSLLSATYACPEIKRIIQALK